MREFRYPTLWGTLAIAAAASAVALVALKRRQPEEIPLGAGHATERSDARRAGRIESAQPSAPQHRERPSLDTPGPGPSPDQIRGELRELGTTPDRRRREVAYARLSRFQLPEELLPEVVSFVRDMLRRDLEDLRCLDLLACFRDDLCFRAALEFAQSGHSRDQRIEAIHLLATRVATPLNLRSMTDLFLTEREGEVRAAVVLSLEAACPEIGRPLIRRGLDDESELVRSITIGTLDPTRDEDRSVLFTMASSDRSEPVRGSALILLGTQVGNPAVVELLLSRASQDDSSQNRVEALQALDQDRLRQDSKVLESIRRLAEGDPSSEVRSRARRTLERLILKQ